MANTYVFKKGEKICRKGDNENWMYEILSGSAAVYVNYGTDSEKKLAEFGAGSYLGELGLLKSVPRSATVIADMDNTELRKITAEEFAGYFGLNEKGMALLSQVSGRLIDVTGNYSEACRTITNLAELEATRAVVKEDENLWDRIIRFTDEYFNSFCNDMQESLT